MTGEKKSRPWVLINMIIQDVTKGSNMEEKSEPFVSHGIVKYDLFGWTNGLKMNNID